MPDYESILIVEDGSIVAGANAYCSAAYMVSYFQTVGVDLTAWGQARRGQRIALATRYLTGVYRKRWQGRRINYQQMLDWPRYGVLLSLGADVDLWFPGFGPGMATADETFPQNQVPVEVMAATCELAYRADVNFNGGAAGGAGALAPDLKPRDASILRKTVGPITIQYDSGANPVPVWSFVQAILRPYLMPGDMQTRIVRG